jgi:solute carrier family 13 (sodium-dependent dicarboxylate transporter), member 2/3/5
VLNENLGNLKLDLLYHGIQLGEGTTLPHDPSGTVNIVLPNDIWVNVTYDADYVSGSPFTLHYHETRWCIETGTESISVQMLAPLKAYKKKTQSGVLVSDILFLHGGFVAVEPMGMCRFTKSGLECKYCRHKVPREKTPFASKDLIEALDLVRKEAPIDVVHLSSGFVGTEDGGVAGLEPLVKEIRRHFNVLISIDVMPPATNQWIDRSYAMGVDAVYYDIDVFNPELFAELYPEKEESIRHKRYLEALEYAAKIFPSGAVCSHLVLGLESLASTMEGVHKLTKLGVLPLLTFFRPMAESDLCSEWHVSRDDLIPLYRDLFEAVRSKRINPNWIRQYDVILTPLEGRFFSDKQSKWGLSLQGFYKTALGRKTALGMASLRRQLRVREIKRPWDG